MNAIYFDFYIAAFKGFQWRVNRGLLEASRYDGYGWNASGFNRIFNHKYFIRGLDERKEANNNQ